jgi:prepilin-type N-terminal cleavage/methylation domain-containing protein/prepilin-type processing-associated H-X9-DG protein
LTEGNSSIVLGKSSIMSKKNAFTLVELLVVIAIIALLMSILIPVLSRAKEQAKNVLCRSNLRQYGVAGTMYLDDNEQAFPPTHTYLFTTTWSTCQWHDEKRWATVDGVMWPYLRERKIHLCPTFRSIAKHRGQNHPYHDPKIPVVPQYGYSMNAHLGPFEAAWEASGRFVKVTQIRRPANFFFFAEENMWIIEEMYVTVLNDTNLWIGAPYDGDYDFFATFHNAPAGNTDRGTCNAVFVDGHAEQLELMDGTLDEAREKAWKVAWPAWPRLQRSPTCPPPE